MCRSDQQEQGYCRKLKSVNVSGNSLIAFTGPVHQLEELTVLDLSDNKLVRLPSALGGLPLQELHVGGNPDLRLPPQVLEGGSAAMINYLQTVGEQHSLVDGYLDQFLQPGPAGPVGTTGGTGFTKAYTYDDRLLYLPPPYFLAPTSSPWTTTRVTDG